MKGPNYFLHINQEFYNSLNTGGYLIPWVKNYYMKFSSIQMERTLVQETRDIRATVGNVIKHSRAPGQLPNSLTGFSPYFRSYWGTLLAFKIFSVSLTFVILSDS